MESPHTITAIKRWSSSERAPPPVESIEMIHIYDFDNTLFRTPLPNKQLWNASALAMLNSKDRFLNGGWWQTRGFLENIGEGPDKEESRAWEGFWNEDIVDLVRLSMQQEDALCVLLTGRSVRNFSDLVVRMTASKGLDFDLTVLKPEAGPSGDTYSSTQVFKQAFLTDLIKTYSKATSIQIYEDRTPHVTHFKNFLVDLNREMMSDSDSGRAAKWGGRRSISGVVTPVPQLSRSLNPVVEIGQVQKMINLHNSAIVSDQIPPGRRLIPWKLGRTVTHTGYLVPPKISMDLQTIVKVPNFVPRDEMQMYATVIPTRPNKKLSEFLQRPNTKIVQRWRVTQTCTFENRLWALQLMPIPTGSSIEKLYNWPAVLVVAMRRGTREDEVRNIKKWYAPPPSHRGFEFDTVLGEKSIIGIEEEILTYDDTNSKSLVPGSAVSEEGEECGYEDENGGGMREYGQPGHPSGADYTDYDRQGEGEWNEKLYSDRYNSGASNGSAPLTTRYPNKSGYYRHSDHPNDHHQPYGPYHPEEEEEPSYGAYYNHTSHPGGQKEYNPYEATGRGGDLGVRGRGSTIKRLQNAGSSRAGLDLPHHHQTGRGGYSHRGGRGRGRGYIHRGGMRQGPVPLGPHHSNGAGDGGAQSSYHDPDQVPAYGKKGVAEGDLYSAY